MNGGKFCIYIKEIHYFIIVWKQPSQWKDHIMDVNTLGKKKDKFVNEDSDTSKEDVNDYKEEYKTHSFYHCALCEYKTIFRI